MSQGQSPVEPGARQGGAEPRGVDLAGQDLQFEVLELVGQGASGAVYRARMRGAEGIAKVVALKVLNPGLGAVGELGSRLRDGARMLGLVRHRALVRVDGLIAFGGRPTLVMEHIDGADLEALVSAGPVPPGPALEIVGEVAAALHAASSARGPDGQALRLLHRDIKPTNVRLTPLGDVKVLDFGFARDELAPGEAETQEFSFGTPDYMAPERLVQHACAAGDIYSVGAVLFELITGEQLGRASTLQGRHDAFVRQRLGHLRRCLLGDDEDLTPEQGREIATELCAFVGGMLAFPIDARPRARDVERSCAKLRQRIGGEALRDWAAEAAPAAPRGAAGPDRDGLTGTVLSIAASTDAFGWLEGSATPAAGDDEPPTVVPLAASDDEPPTVVPLAAGAAKPLFVGSRLAGPSEAPAAADASTATAAAPPAGDASTATAAVPPAGLAGASGPVAAPAEPPGGAAPTPTPTAASRPRPPHITSSPLAAPGPAPQAEAPAARGAGWLIAIGLVGVASLVGVALVALDAGAPPASTVDPPAVTIAPPPPPAPVEAAPEPELAPDVVAAPTTRRKRSTSAGANPAGAAAAPAEAADTNAHVSLAGDAVAAWLTSKDGRFAVGAVPPGSYQIQVQFPDRAPVSGGRLKVVAGQSVVLECTTAAQRCTAR